MIRFPISLVLTFTLLAGPLGAEDPVASIRTSVPAWTFLPGHPDRLALPWREAGWSERQAAALLLDRLTFGARPGEVERVLAQGLEIWVERQLTANLQELRLATSLEPFPAVAMSELDLARAYPPRAQLVRMAELENVITCAAYQGERKAIDAMGKKVRDADGPQVRLEIWAEANGYQPQDELTRQLNAQKLLRALYAENQLREVLTDFWYNHFNVSWHDLKSRGFMLPYERDAIRPNVLGSFRTLLGATARHPAMLTYLDNAQSRANEGAPVAFVEPTRPGFKNEEFEPEDDDLMGQGPQQAPGVNENYARELLELHTLGVDGGYDQADVFEVARAFTGWTVVSHLRVKEDQERLRAGSSRDDLGYFQQGLFQFRADKHDAGPKTVLGTTLPAGRGLEDGEDVLDLLARHRSTARHVAHKLAVRFVADDPPQALVEHLAERFLSSDGDLRAVMRALVSAPEFWSKDVRRQKIKSPFELAISALRAVDADVRNPGPIVAAIAEMGQPLYAHQAPTGFPDRADAWVNSGALLARMNFGMQLATEQFRGTRFKLRNLVAGPEPASAEEALGTYLALLLPERETAPVVPQLGPLVNELGLGDRLEEATMAAVVPPEASITEISPERASATMLSQVIGVILGSPEFQRR